MILIVANIDNFDIDSAAAIRGGKHLSIQLSRQILDWKDAGLPGDEGVSPGAATDAKMLIETTRVRAEVLRSESMAPTSAL